VARPRGDSSSRASGGDVRTFLIADVRGYTAFTHKHGDDAAAALAERFAHLAREAVAEYDGEVIELRGDEALAVFSSARQALRAAVELQRRARTAGESSFPLGIGIGLDSGEAVPLEGGYRGGALNLASRLCALAKPGEILVSETVVGLARRVEGLRFRKRRRVQMKGLEQPVPVIEAIPEPPLPPAPVVSRPRRSFLKRRKWPLLAAAALLVALAVALPLTLRSGGQAALPESVIAIPRSFTGLVQVDPRTDDVLTRIPTPGPPSTGVEANGSLWIGEQEGIEQANPSTGQVLDRIPITQGVPGQLSGNEDDGIWLAHPEVEPFALDEFDPYRKTVTQRLRLPGRPTAGPYVGAGYVWLVVGGNTIFKIDPETAKVVDRIPYAFPSQETAGAADAGEGALWIADPDALASGQGLKFGVIVRIDAKTDEITKVAVPRANGVVVGGGAVWARSGNDANNPGTGNVTEINPDTNHIIHTTHVGRADWLAAGSTGVWAQNDANHTATRINPATGEVVSILLLPKTTEAIDYLGGALSVVAFP
jgi:class 3 adenylate cyclase/streptogramin lyase